MLFRSHDAFRHRFVAFKIWLLPESQRVDFVISGTRRALNYMRKKLEDRGGTFLAFFTNNRSVSIYSHFVPSNMDERLARQIDSLGPSPEVSIDKVAWAIETEKSTPVHGIGPYPIIQGDSHISPSYIRAWAMDLANLLEKSDRVQAILAKLPPAKTKRSGQSSP